MGRKLQPGRAETSVRSACPLPKSGPSLYGQLKTFKLTHYPLISRGKAWIPTPAFAGAGSVSG
jgi:hypothetical protein